jgi:hypothetical protein
MDDLRGNENRARQEKAGVMNRMTPRTSTGTVAGGTRFDPNSVPGTPMPPSIRGDAPITTDPHRLGRHSFDNTENKPGEATRAERSGETRRRIYSRNTEYKYR